MWRELTKWRPSCYVINSDFTTFKTEVSLFLTTYLPCDPFTGSEFYPLLIVCIPEPTPTLRHVVRARPPALPLGGVPRGSAPWPPLPRPRLSDEVRQPKEQRLRRHKTPPWEWAFPCRPLPVNPVPSHGPYPRPVSVPRSNPSRTSPRFGAPSSETALPDH